MGKGREGKRGEGKGKTEGKGKRSWGERKASPWCPPPPDSFRRLCYGYQLTISQSCGSLERRRVGYTSSVGVYVTSTSSKCWQEPALFLQKHYSLHIQKLYGEYFYTLLFVTLLTGSPSLNERRWCCRSHFIQITLVSAYDCSAVSTSLTVFFGERIN